MKLLLAVDGSSHSDSAIELITQRTWPEGTECRIVCAVEPLNRGVERAFSKLGQLAEQAQKALEADVQKLLEEYVSKLKDKFGADKVSYEFLEGDPVKKIVEAAKKHNADVILLGHPGGSGVEDHWFESVTRGVIVEAHCTVEVLHPISTYSVEEKLKKKETLTESKVLLALDGSPNSQAALNAVLAMPWPANTHFQALSVVLPYQRQTNPRFFQSAEIKKVKEEMQAHLKSDAEKLVQEATAKLSDKFGKDKVTGHVLKEGNARSAILQIAQDWPADRVVAGAHDKDKSIAEHVFGSTAAALVLNANCSVLLVKAKA